MTDSETEKLDRERELDRIRQQRYREKRKALRRVQFWADQETYEHLQRLTSVRHLLPGVPGAPTVDAIVRHAVKLYLETLPKAYSTSFR